MTVSEQQLAEFFELLEEPDLAALLGRPRIRWNIAPTEPVATVLPADSPETTAGAVQASSNLQPQRRCRLAAMRWGISQTFTKGRPLFNARREKLRDRYWAEAFAARRCLIPVTEFYEWRDVGARRRRPYAITLRKSPQLSAFAGIWSESLDRESGELIPWCSVITTPANELMREIHNAGANKHRQPAFVSAEDFGEWLSADLTEEAADRILSERPSEDFVARPLAAVGNDERGAPPVDLADAPPAGPLDGPPATNPGAGGTQSGRRSRTRPPGAQPELPFGK